MIQTAHLCKQPELPERDEPQPPVSFYKPGTNEVDEQALEAFKIIYEKKLAMSQQEAHERALALYSEVNNLDWDVGESDMEASHHSAWL